MGNCATMDQNRKLPPNSQLVYEQNKENKVWAQKKQKIQEMKEKLVKDSDRLKIKMRQKRVRERTDIHPPELNYTVHDNNVAVEFKIKIRKSRQWKKSIYPIDDQIPEPINEQHGMFLYSGLDLQPIEVDMNLMANNIIESVHYHDSKRDGQLLTSSSTVHTDSFKSENSL